MKTNLLIIGLSLIILIHSGCSEKSKTQIPEPTKAVLRKDAKEFMESLKSVLMKEMQTNGIASAVSVCADTAQLLTNSFGITKGIYIKRVSFKNRNPNNKPDDFETKALDYFDKLKSEGQLNESTEFVEVTEFDGDLSIRYLKPIIMQAPCLNCHGPVESIMPDVKEIISQKYPDDKAHGYKIGDLRGAISIQKKF